MGNIIVKSGLSIFAKALYLLKIVFGGILKSAPTTLLLMVLLSLVTIITPLGVNADPPNETSSVSSTHWVVVIRNTRLMQDKHKKAIVDTLPTLIFQGPATNPETSLKFPAFNPIHDRLSLVFAAVHDSERYYKKTRKRYPIIRNEIYPDGCLNYLKKRNGSAKLEHFFIAKEAYIPISSKQELGKLLTKWVMNDACLFKGLDFNEFIAENAVVPFLRSERSQLDRSKNTIIVLVNNTEGSLSMDKAKQIKEFENSYLKAREFRTDSIIVNPADWIFTVSSGSNVAKRGLGLDTSNNNILIHYLISKATYLPDEFKSRVVKFEKELQNEINKLLCESGDSKICSPDNTPTSQCFNLDKYGWIAIIILIAVACFGPWLMYYYMRSKNRICRPE